jgi:uncharacterized membrane protein
MAHFWRITTLVSYFGLFFLLLFWTVWLSPPQYFPISMALIILIGPLLLALRGILYGRPYVHIATALLALCYFTVGVFHAAGEMHKPWLAYLEILCSVLLFLSTLAYVQCVQKR